MLMKQHMESAFTQNMQRMMEEHLYWAAVYMRWVDPATRPDWLPYMRELLGVPTWLAPLVSRVAARRMAGTLRHHGLGRHSPETIWRLGIADVQALAHWLGQRPWGFGDAPTVVDAVTAA